MNKIIFVLILVPTMVFGQNKVNFNQGEIRQNKFCDTIPFEFIKDKIILKVKIGGSFKRFIFDTGNTLAISEEIQNIMKNPILDSVIQTDVLGAKKKINSVKVREFELGHLKFTDVPAVVTNVKESGFLTCFDYDGFIGSNALRNCILQIDLRKKYLIITNEISKLELQNFHKTDLRLDKQSGPNLKVKIGEKIEFEALFDSGSDEFLSISNEIYNKIEKKKLSKTTNEGFGITTVAMHGTEKQATKKRVSIQSVDFDNFAIQNTVSVISSHNTGNAFGLKLAEYGIITIDYINKQFYFQPFLPIQEFKDKTTIGFTLMPEENSIKIGVVWSNTQAAKLGLKSGYKILKLNQIDLTRRTPQSDCELFLTQPTKGKSVELTYQDENNEVKTVKLEQEF
jgi:predicted aspartyl protease